MGVSLASCDCQALSRDQLNDHLLAVQRSLEGVTDLVEGVASILRNQEMSETDSRSKYLIPKVISILYYVQRLIPFD